MVGKSLFFGAEHPAPASPRPRNSPPGCSTGYRPISGGVPDSPAAPYSQPGFGLWLGRVALPVPVSPPPPPGRIRPARRWLVRLPRRLVQPRRLANGAKCPLFAATERTRPANDSAAEQSLKDWAAGFHRWTANGSAGSDSPATPGTAEATGLNSYRSFPDTPDNRPGYRGL